METNRLLHNVIRDWIFEDLSDKFGKEFATYYVSDLDNFNPQQFADKNKLKFNFMLIERSFEWYIAELQYHYEILKKTNQNLLK